MPRAPPPPLNETRMDVVQAAWYKIANGAESAPLASVKDAFDATRHPRVLDGNMSAGEAKEILARHFDGVADGIVRWEDFLQYHVRISNEVDKGRAVDRDGTFVNVVVQVWRLDKDPSTAMAPTGIIPVTLDCPSGLKRTRNMSLVWADETKDNTLWSFQNSVKTRFGRRVLPPQIRGHFAFADEELRQWAVKPSPSRSALMTPQSIVWLDEAGKATGLREVVLPNVDLERLPPALRAVLMSHQEAEKRYGAVDWLPLEDVYNPAYQKSSEAFGKDAYQSAQAVLELKKKVYEGNNCGVAWHGHTGKFTDSFHGGPYSFAGLNTATTRK